jgi:hypothetical protein
MPPRLEIRNKHLSLRTVTTVNKILHTSGKLAEPNVLRIAYGSQTTVLPRLHNQLM